MNYQVAYFSTKSKEISFNHMSKATFALKPLPPLNFGSKIPIDSDERLQSCASFRDIHWSDLGPHNYRDNQVFSKVLDIISCSFNIDRSNNEDRSNNVFREILKCFRKTAKFKYFAKQIIYLESPYHLLQSDIWYVCVLRVWNFFKLPKMAQNPTTSRK